MNFRNFPASSAASVSLTDPSSAASRNSRRSLLACAAVSVLAGSVLTGCFPDDGTGPGSDDSSQNQESAPESGQTSSSDQPQAALTATDANGKPATLCDTKNLGITTEAPTGGAGSSFYTLKFTNNGDASCVLKGFPGVSLVTDNNGTQLGPSAKREENIESSPVTLEKGQTATSALRLSSVGPFDPEECKPASADGLRIYPPENTASAYLPLENVEGCRGDVPVLSVQPITQE